jgi:hypothetical protein
MYTADQNGINSNSKPTKSVYSVTIFWKTTIGLLKGTAYTVAGTFTNKTTDVLQTKKISIINSKPTKVSTQLQSVLS